MFTEAEIEEAVIELQKKRGAKRRLTNVRVDELSLVDNPAIARGFVIAKRDATPPPAPAPQLTADDRRILAALDSVSTQMAMVANDFTLFDLQLGSYILERKLAMLGR